MENIERVSEITAEIAGDYLHIPELTDEDTRTLNYLIEIAKSYIKGYTGRTEDEMDFYPDFIIVVLILVQDMYDNRTLYVNNEKLNFVVDNILHMHSVNLL